MFYNKHKLNEMTFCFVNNFLISFTVYEKYSGKKSFIQGLENTATYM